MSTLHLSADHARRFLVRRHLLDPPRALPAEPASVLRVVDRLGLLQFDPLEVPGARSHDLTLHARIGGYRREWCDRWLYGPPGGDPADRQLIELYNKSLNILPIAELPHYALAWDHSHAHYRDRILRDQAAVAEAILERIRADGPLSTAAFREHNHAIDWWWAPTPAARAVAEALFVSGRLGIARREGSRRYYELIERLVPATLLERRESAEDAARHRLLSRYRAVGLLGSVLPGEIAVGTGKTPERRRHLARLVDGGTLLRGPRRGPATHALPPRSRASDPGGDRGRRARRGRAAIGLLPRSPGSARLGPAPPARPVRLRLRLGGVHPGGEAQVGLLRPAHPLRRPARGSNRTPRRTPHTHPSRPWRLVRGRLRADGGARLRSRPRRGPRRIHRLRGRTSRDLAPDPTGTRPRGRPTAMEKGRRWGGRGPG